MYISEQYLNNLEEENKPDTAASIAFQFATHKNRMDGVRSSIKSGRRELENMKLKRADDNAYISGKNRRERETEASNKAREEREADAKKRREDAKPEIVKKASSVAGRIHGLLKGKKK